ncbi:hypothetical protein NST58_01520 [Paenibacillus sp. FSL R10-2796]|uniref:hypothetical protein n=1 Tax=Paenibacillus sp. FSL R10-2796 TaxID=2954663 RepID=UPI0030DB2934
MAKKLDDITNRRLTVIPFKAPDKPFTPRYTPKCGCGSEAEYEVYVDAQPHCRNCLDDALGSSVPVLVRKLL